MTDRSRMTGVDRRHVLGMLALAGAAPLAGCASGDETGPGGTSEEEQVNGVPPASGLLDPNHIALSGDGSRLAALMTDGVGLWTTKSGELERTVSAQVAHALTWSPATGLLAAGGTKGDILLLDDESGDVRRTLSGHERADGGTAIHALRLSPDGSRLASAGGDGTVRLWQTDGGDSRVVEMEGVNPRALDFHPDGAQLAVAGLDEAVRIVDVERGEVVTTLRDSPPQGVALSFSPDGRRLVTGSAQTPAPGEVRSFATSTWEPERDALLTGVAPVAIAVDPDSERVAVGDQQGETIEVVSLDGGSTRTVDVSGRGIRGLVWSPDGRALYAASASTGITAWDPATGKEIRRFAVEQG